jgi:hypothetical protein
MSGDGGGWQYHAAFPYSDALRRERKVRVWQSHANARDGRRPVTMASAGLGPRRHQAREAFVQLPTGPPRTPHPTLEARRRTEAATSSHSWQARARTPIWADESNPKVNKAQLAKLGTGPAVWLSHTPPPEPTLPPVNHVEIAEGGPFLQFFLQRPFKEKEVKDSIPQARKADAQRRRVRDQAQLKLETERLNDSLRFLESIGLSPRRPKKPVHDPRLFLTQPDAGDDDDEQELSPGFRLQAELGRYSGGRPSTAGSTASRMLSGSRPGTASSSRPASSRPTSSRPASSKPRA